MVAIKSPGNIAQKWSRVTPTRQQDFEEGVKQPRKDWRDATVAANTSYKSGLQASLSEDRWVKGVDKAGTSKWQRRTLDVGPARWAQGVSSAANAYEVGFRPYAETLLNLQLPARGPKGDPNNIQRVAAVAKALHDTKISLGK